MRQIDLGRQSTLVWILAVNWPVCHWLPSHAHEWAQLVFASSGAMTVETDQGAWVSPPELAIWVPAGTAHNLTMSGRVHMRTLYFSCGIARRAPAQSCVLSVSRLLRELILHVVSLGALHAAHSQQRRLAHVIVDQLITLPITALEEGPATN